MTYIESLKLIGRGSLGILRLLPQTFAKNTRAMITKHPIYLLFFLSIIGYQFSTIAKERIDRDKDAKEIFQLQEKLDSITMKHFSYQKY